METFEKLIAALYAEPSNENNKAILIYLRKLCKKNQTILIPVQEDRPLRLTMEQGDNVYVAFTNLKEKELGPSCEVKEESLAEILRLSNVSEAVSGLSINPWGQSYYLPKVYCEMILDDKNLESEIKIVQGDITTFTGDCIVNAANASLLGGGGVDGAIHRKAGPQLLKECRNLHGCKTGQAKITQGYQLPARYVIHTVGPIYSGKHEDSHALRDCYWNSLTLAKQYDIHSIAFPAISCGVYGYPLKEAVPIALKTVADWLDQNKDYTMHVCFYCFDAETKAIYDQCTHME